MIVETAAAKAVTVGLVAASAASEKAQPSVAVAEVALSVKAGEAARLAADAVEAAAFDAVAGSIKGSSISGSGMGCGWGESCNLGIGGGSFNRGV